LSKPKFLHKATAVEFPLETLQGSTIPEINIARVRLGACPFIILVKKSPFVMKWICLKRLVID
jgi:hypothetical protein